MSVELKFSFFYVLFIGGFAGLNYWQAKKKSQNQQSNRSNILQFIGYGLISIIYILLWIQGVAIKYLYIFGFLTSLAFAILFGFECNELRREEGSSTIFTVVLSFLPVFISNGIMYGMLLALW